MGITVNAGHCCLGGRFRAGGGEGYGIIQDGLDFIFNGRYFLLRRCPIIQGGVAQAVNGTSLFPGQPSHPCCGKPWDPLHNDLDTGKFFLQ